MGTILSILGFIVNLFMGFKKSKDVALGEAQESLRQKEVADAKTTDILHRQDSLSDDDVGGLLKPPSHRKGS